MKRAGSAIVSSVLLGILANYPIEADKKKPKPLSASQVFKRSVPAIVAIDCLGDKGAVLGTASGFLVGDNGKIFTNLHVISLCQELKVRLTSGDIYDTATVMAVDARRDLALIRIKAASLPVLPLGDSNDIEVGQQVFSIGNPKGLQNTLQQGLVSGFQELNGSRLVQVSASINPGNSGGPILDDQARVIAIASAKMNGAENLGFAIPINYAKGYLDSKNEIAFVTFAAAVKQALANVKAAGGGGGIGSPANAGVGTPSNGAGVIGGIPGGAPGAAPNGVIGGILGTPPTAAPPPPPPVGIGGGVYRVGGHVTAPTILTKVEPEYAELARRAHLEGTVSLTFVIDETGTPKDIRVTKAVGLGLDEKAIEAVQKWRFKPGTKDGQPVAVISSVDVNFRLLMTPAAPVAAPLGFGVIETIAGKDWSFSGDGMPAVQVALAHSWGVATDRAGNIYATDNTIPAIVEVDTDGRLHVLAGPNSPAHLNNPFGVTTDSSGTVYFTENTGRIRKLLPNGDAMVIAGGDKLGFSPDGSPAVGSPISNTHGVAIAPDGSVVFSELGNNRIRRVDAQGRLQTIVGDGQGRFAGDGGPAVSASLLHPSGIAYDAQGDLLIADQNNRRIRKVTPDGRISTVFGEGVTKDVPFCITGVAVDESGDVFGADPCRRLIYMIRNGESSIIGGTDGSLKEPSGLGGPAAAAGLDEWALAVTKDGDLIVSGPDYGRVYRIDRAHNVSLVAGAGNWRAAVDGAQARDSFFQRPSHIAVGPSSAIFMSDFAADRIYRIDSNGAVTRLAGSGRPHFDGENQLARDSNINQPLGIRVRPNGAVVFTDRGNQRVREIRPNGPIHTIAGNGRAEYSGDGGRATNAALNNPVGICLDSAGNVYIADTGNQRVRKVAPDGTIQLVAGNGTRGFSGDGGPAERAALNTPLGVEIGPDGSLYIADAGNRRVRKVTAGVITTVVGTGGNRFDGDGGPALQASMSWPYELAFGPDRELYILDATAARVRRFDPASGTITTVAGNGSRSISGDGGPALAAGLGQAEGLAFDLAGNMYLTDIQSGRVRVAHASAAPGAQAGGGQAPKQIASIAPDSLSSGPPIQVSTDRLVTFLRGKIGMWTADDSKIILGAGKEQPNSSGRSLTFETSQTAFATATLTFSASDKLASVSFRPAQSVKWDAQLAFMRTAFHSDEFTTTQNGENNLYTFSQSKTGFLVRPDGTIVAITIF